MVDNIAHIGIFEEQLILITRATGRPGNQFSVQANLYVAGIEAFAGISCCLYGQCKVSVAQLLHTLQIGNDGGGIRANGRIVFICLLGYIANAVNNLGHRGIAIFHIQSKDIGLISAKCCLVILSVAGQIFAIAGCGTVLQLHAQSKSVTIDQICIERQHIII